MNTNLFRVSFFLLISFTIAFPAFSQQVSCKKEALSALKTMPKLEYECPQTDMTVDDLDKPFRVNAIRTFTKSLETANLSNWWQTPVDDLNACSIRKEIGVLTKEQKEELQFVDLFGKGQIRVINIPDPCYQNSDARGSNIFLLNRNNGKTFATEIIDGFFTRADAIFVDYAINGTEQIIEISTTNSGFAPSYTNYYFIINPKTNRGVQKNLFIEDKKPTNEITSMMDMEDNKSKTDPLKIIQKGRLAKSFYKLVDKFGDGNFTKKILRWNGKFYQ